MLYETEVLHGGDKPIDLTESAVIHRPWTSFKIFELKNLPHTSF
jgi:hypothetical protein